MKHEEFSGSVSIAQIAKKLEEVKDDTGKSQKREPFAYLNKLTGTVLLKNRPPWDKSEVWEEKELDKFDVLKATEWISYVSDGYWICRPSSIQEAIELVSSRVSHDPFKEWVSKLEWDGKSRIDRLPELLGIEESETSKNILCWFLRGIVLKASGGSIDPRILVIHDSKNQLKHEKIFHQMAAYAESVRFGFDGRTNQDSKVMDSNAIITVLGASQFKSSSFMKLCSTSFGSKASLVAFASGPLAEKPEYAYWPVQASEISEFNTSLSRAEWNQIFAECSQLREEVDYGLIRSWSLEMGDSDPWVPVIYKWAMENGVKETYIHCVARDCLKIPPERWTHSTEIRIGKVLLSIGFTNGQRIRIGKGERVRTYVLSSGPVVQSGPIGFSETGPEEKQ